MNDTAIVPAGSAALASGSQFDGEQIELIKRTIAKGATNDELDLFIAQCNRTGLDPFARQIFAVKRWDSQANRMVMSVQISIDGFRLVAQRTGKYRGQLGPFWCGPDGGWRDVWLDNQPPAAAKIAVLHADFKEPLWAVARFDAYAQTKKDGGLNSMWAKMPDIMIAKCAEALALRKAFPLELSGLYTTDEMMQASESAPTDRNGHETPQHLQSPSQQQSQSRRPSKQSASTGGPGHQAGPDRNGVMRCACGEEARQSQSATSGKWFFICHFQPRQCDWMQECPPPSPDGSDVIEGEVDPIEDSDPGNYYPPEPNGSTPPEDYRPEGMVMTNGWTKAQGIAEVQRRLKEDKPPLHDVNTGTVNQNGNQSQRPAMTPALKRLWAFAGEFNLDCSKDAKTARTAATNRRLMGWGQQPVKSWNDLTPDQCGALCEAIERGELTWRGAGQESQQEAQQEAQAA